MLLGLAGVGWWLVRREMRPLEDMAATAGAIAGGDLSRRVEPAEPGTEVGRLGLALNVMLTQIEQAFARRQASENALRRFLAQASHELRTPLASIRGYAELFRRGARDKPEDLELAMRRIEQEAARMGVLVEELLLLARLDEGRPLERAPVDLARVAADVVADARITDPGRSITCEASQPVVVTGDDARLRQVTTNLVANAVRHAGRDAHVWVNVRASDDWAELEVRDDGVGIPAEVAQRVFEPFFTGAALDEGDIGAVGQMSDDAEQAGGVDHAGGDPEQTGIGAGSSDGDAAPADLLGAAVDDVAADRADGPALPRSATGLGLAIALSIAHAHGGRIDLESAPGQGARFTVRLPRGVDGSAAVPDHEA